MQETRFRSLGQEDTLEKEMATHSSILAWRIPWTEEPGELVHGVTKSQTGVHFHFHNYQIVTLIPMLPMRKRSEVKQLA